MKRFAALSLLVAIAMVQILIMARPSEGVTCGQINSALAPCVSYLTGGPGPSTECCKGVTSIRDITPTQADRRAACECVKTAASSFTNLKPDAASNLPSKCGVPINIPISPNTNCGSIP